MTETQVHGVAQCEDLSVAPYWGRHVMERVDGEWTCVACGETRTELIARHRPDLKVSRSWSGSKGRSW